MAKRPTITTITSGYYSTETLNANFTAIVEHFDNFVSRDASSPNAMAGDLDMDGNDVLNVGTLNVASLTVDNVDLSTYLGTTSTTADIAGLTLSNGDLLYYDGSNINRLAIGSDGQALKVVGGVPAWSTDNDTNTVGITIQENGVTVQDNVTTLNYTSTVQSGFVTSPTQGQVDIDITSFLE